MVPDNFHNSNTIFHYTNAQTVIEYILHNNEIKLSPRKNSSDIIENQQMIISQAIAVNDSQIELRTIDNSEKIEEAIRNRVENNNQSSFCMNDFSNIGNELGYLKSRMWDQYGDKYKGICLAFDLKKLILNPKILFAGKIKYLSFEDLLKDYPEIDGNKLNIEGTDKYEKEVIKYTDKLLLRKHIDYRDEREYRICTVGEEYISIEESLIGIFIHSKFVNNFTLTWLKDYSKNNPQIKLFYINTACAGDKVRQEYNSMHIQTMHSYRR